MNTFACFYATTNLQKSSIKHKIQAKFTSLDTKIRKIVYAHFVILGPIYQNNPLSKPLGNSWLYRPAGDIILAWKIFICFNPAALHKLLYLY